MTTIQTRLTECPNCATQTYVRLITSTNNFEGYGLDLKPLGMGLDAQFDTAGMCECCGMPHGLVVEFAIPRALWKVAHYLSFNKVKEIMESDGFKSLHETATKDSAEGSYIRSEYITSQLDKSSLMHFFDIQVLGWLYHKQKRASEENAQLTKLADYDMSDIPSDHPQLYIVMQIRVDALRRLGRFSDAITLANNSLFGGLYAANPGANLMEQNLKLCGEEDSKYHRISYSK